MDFKSIMHVALYVSDMDKSINFYVNKLGGKVKMIARYGSYMNSDKEYLRDLAIKDPEGVYLVYIEIASGQFLELFPKFDFVKSKDEFSRVGVWHFSLLVEDIYRTRKKFIERNIPLDTEITIGNSFTYKMWSHDPDGNMFEIMQFTDKSYQIVGNI